jgi:hypothetical protein
MLFQYKEDKPAPMAQCTELYVRIAPVFNVLLCLVLASWKGGGRWEAAACL